MKRLLVFPVVLAMVVTFAPGALAARRHRAIFVDDSCNAVQTGTSRHPFCTINAALTAASPGATIRVRPGFYDELVDVNKPDLTLLGPMARKPGAANRTDLRREAVVSHADGDFHLDQQNVTVAGFTIMDVQDSPASLEAGVLTNHLFGGYHITNNVIRNNVQGIAFGSSGAGGSKISGNLILSNNNSGSNGGTGIDGAFETHDVTIVKNVFRNNNAQSILFERLAATPANTDIRVMKNSADSPFLFYNTTGSSISRNNLKGGNGSALFFGDDTSGITVSRNRIAAPSFRGIRFRLDFGGAAPTGFTITRNTIDGTGLDGIAAGDPGDTAPAALLNSTISRNRITGSDGDGLLFAPGSVGNTVSGNKIVGNRHFDIEDDNVSGNTYTHNRCRTSSPSTIC